MLCELYGADLYSRAINSPIQKVLRNIWTANFLYQFFLFKSQNLRLKFKNMPKEQSFWSSLKNMAEISKF